MIRVRTVILWMITILAAAAMVRPGVQKFTSPFWQQMFRVWGYPEHFYLVIGAIEVVAGLGLLVPRFASASAIALAAVMAGAFVTRVAHGNSGVGEMVFMALLGIVAYGRWPGVLARRPAG
jgi:putative oxidoreductase